MMQDEKEAGFDIERASFLHIGNGFICNPDQSFGIEVYHIVIFLQGDFIKQLKLTKAACIDQNCDLRLMLLQQCCIGSDAVLFAKVERNRAN